jgi:hypothetical protein
LSYSNAASAHKLNHGDIYKNAESGITDEVVANAFAMVKSGIEAAGLTPPASSSILAVAENFFIKAELVWKGRMMGDLPAGTGSMSTYDNVNKSYNMFMKLGNEHVEKYIQSAQTSVQPGDTSGVSRSDYEFKDFKLNQNSIKEPVDIDGESLADDQRG